MFRLFLFLFPVALFVNADDNTEVIEVLAPKGALTLTTTSLSKDDLDERYHFDSGRTIADKLISIPGLSLNGQGGQFQSYSIRGFSRSRIRTDIDGIPIMTDRRAGNAVSFISPELFTLGQVIKGPSSTLYGSQALGGVVSLSTQPFDSSDQTIIKVAAQPNNQAVNFTTKHTTKTIGANLAYQSAGNDTAADGRTLHTQFERLSGALRYQSKNNQTGLTTVVSWLPSYGQDIGKSNIKYPQSEISRYPEEIHSLAQVQVRSESGWLAKLFHHYQDWSSETQRINSYHSFTEYHSHTLGGQWLSSHQFGATDNFIGVDWLSRKGVKIASTYQGLNDAVDIETIDVETVDIATIDMADFSNSDLNAAEDNLAIFAKTHWQLDQTQVQFGLRYDWLTQQSDVSTTSNDSELTASVALTYPITHSLDMSVDIGTGFRYPTLSERFFSGVTPRAYVQGNPNLLPETSLGAQLVLNWQSRDNVNIKTAFYHYTMNNYIERYSLNDSRLSYRNVTQATISGFEVELQWYIDDELEHHFNFQHQDGEDDDNQTLNDLIPQQINWIMHYQLGDWQLANAFRYQFSTKNVGDSETPRAHALVWNFSVDYQLSHRQSVQLVFNNVTNERYYASLDEDATLQPEQSIKLATIWRY